MIQIFFDDTVECTPEEAFSAVGKNIIFISGSPFQDVDLGWFSESLLISLFPS